LRAGRPSPHHPKDFWYAIGLFEGLSQLEKSNNLNGNRTRNSKHVVYKREKVCRLFRNIAENDTH
jgi:hypothetical protein